MNWLVEHIGNFLGPILILVFLGTVLVFTAAGRNQPGRNLRDVTAFTRLRRMVGLAVEAGTRLHISLGAGGLLGPKGVSGLAGLTVLERVTRAASISDRPPVATSGDGSLGILSRDTLRDAYANVSAENLYDPTSGQVTGLTPFSFAAGALLVIHDEQVSTNIFVGHFGTEVALLTEAGDRNDAVTVAGTDDLSGQAVLYATAQEPLIGEEIYAGGAYLNAGPVHAASLRAQDVFRFLLVIIILIGAIARLVGLL